MMFKSRAKAPTTVSVRKYHDFEKAFIVTPGARVAAAIEILDQINEGGAAEQTLTRWGRANRFAGSKDRAAIRDHVFDVLRQKRHAVLLGGGITGRAMMIGLCRLGGIDMDGLFNGQGHAPAPLTDHELIESGDAATQGDDWDLPDWLVPLFEESLAERAQASATALQSRAPITLRVNTARLDVASAIAMLAEQGIETVQNPLAAHALTVTGGARKIRNSDAYTAGEVELQDAASQAVVAGLPTGARVLDYCAGGGGKSLAAAMDTERSVTAHDIDPRRMQDLPQRAGRAGAQIAMVETADLAASGPFDVVLCDAPCSGSGAWRRAPEGKWTLSADRLVDLTAIQDDVLSKAKDLVAPNGYLVYATCSVLNIENEARVAAFLAQNTDWQCTYSKRFDVDENGDGFFAAHLKRA